VFKPKAFVVKFFIDSWYLFAVAIVSGGLLWWPTLRRGVPAGGVSCAYAVQLINRERAVVIDVREPAEFGTGHLVNSKNVPLAQLQNSKILPKNKALPLVLVCRSGAAASRAVVMLKGLGYAQAYTLTGGLNAWSEAKFPLEKISA
jgi:rhodanese-related sulfurtransferase